MSLGLKPCIGTTFWETWLDNVYADCSQLQAPKMNLTDLIICNPHQKSPDNVCVQKK